MAFRPRFDYDEGDIHRTYRGGRALTPEQGALWSSLLRDAMAAAPPGHIVDLGCGVGRFVGILRDLFGARVTAIDRSVRMLATAGADPDLSGTGWVCGSVEALPLRPATADLALLFLVYHHLVDRPAALRECRRLLTRSGRLLIVNSTLESLDSYLWLPFFPSARDIDRARLPSRDGLVVDAGQAGLRLCWHRTVANPVASSLTSYADRIATRTISSLQMLSDAEFERGVEEFRRFCAREDRRHTVHDEIDAFLFAGADEQGIEASPRRGPS